MDFPPDLFLAFSTIVGGLGGLELLDVLSEVPTSFSSGPFLAFSTTVVSLGGLKLLDFCREFS